MKAQHIVIVFDAGGQLQVQPHTLRVKYGDDVIFFSEDHDMEVDFSVRDTPFDHTQFLVLSGNYMSPESVTERSANGSGHNYTITALNAKDRSLKQIDPVIIVDPYPLMDKTRAIKVKPPAEK